MRFSLILISFLALLLPYNAIAEVSSMTDKVVSKFMNLDSNGSGTVSISEYQSMVLKRMRQRFRQMDANRDGQISEQEYRNFWVKTKSNYYRPRRE